MNMQLSVGRFTVTPAGGADAIRRIKMFVKRPLNSYSINSRRTVCGVGINDAAYIVSLKKEGMKTRICPVYRAWSDMIKRCYNPRTLNAAPSYIDCTVDKEWHKFSNFSEWMVSQDWQGKVLDKDLLIPGNRMYGPKGCHFVTIEVNGLLVNSSKPKSPYPLGVSFHTSKGKLRATCKANNKAVHIGYFATVASASRAYKEFKSNHIRLVAESYKDEKRVFRALIAHANYILK